ncbi:MAG: hypothetical protein NVSMB49_24450 [Ktedonobacteraceae bacterium]
MSVADDKSGISARQECVEQIHVLFSQLDPQQVEEFYQSYHYWRRRQQATTLQEQIVAVEQHIVDNNMLMQQLQPSPIALAALTRLQVYGVDDVDLLDTMLERGDTWLDHTLQLLEQCERLGFIDDNFTEWCQHALEGAYDWLESIDEAELQQSVQLQSKPVAQEEIADDTTEGLLLQKLMSEDEAIKRPSSPDVCSQHSIAIPSILSYIVQEPKIATSTREGRSPTSIAPESAVTSKSKPQKSPKNGLLFRIMAKVWQN